MYERRSAQANQVTHAAPARSLRGFLADERGLETLETAIMIAIIASGTIAALTAIGLWVAGRYGELQTALGA